MIPPVTVDIPSDGEEDDVLAYNPGVPVARRQRDETVPILLIDTPQKEEVVTSSVVPETPYSGCSDVSIVKCTLSQSFATLPNDKTSGELIGCSLRIPTGCPPLFMVRRFAGLVVVFLSLRIWYSSIWFHPSEIAETLCCDATV